MHVCLLSIARLAKRFQWIHFIGVQIIFGFALLLCAVTWELIDLDEMTRLIAATSIMIAAFSLTIPILHRISKMDPNGAAIRSPLEERNLVAIDDEIRRMQQRLDELHKIAHRLSIKHTKPPANKILPPPKKPSPTESGLFPHECNPVFERAVQTLCVCRDSNRYPPLKTRFWLAAT